MDEHEESPEVHNISVAKLDNDKFRVIFGQETGVPDLYSASARLDLDRSLLEEFVKSAQEALKE